MNATTNPIKEAAIKFGKEHRAAYVAEFGCEPEVGQTGDWDSTGCTETWIAISRQFETTDEDFETVRDGYLTGLFGEGNFS